MKKAHKHRRSNSHTENKCNHWIKLSPHSISKYSSPRSPTGSRSRKIQCREGDWAIDNCNRTSGVSTRRYTSLSRASTCWRLFYRSNRKFKVWEIRIYLEIGCRTIETRMLTRVLVWVITIILIATVGNRNSCYWKW